MIGVFKVKIKLKKLKTSTIAEVFILLGAIAIVIACFMISAVLGMFSLGISLIVLGVLLLKVVALRSKGGG